MAAIRRRRRSRTPRSRTAYAERFAENGAGSRLVCGLAQDETWDTWERHPGGEEVVFLISGRVDLVRELDGTEHAVALHPGEAVANPAGV